MIDLQGIRNRAGMTQQQLADHIGVTRGQIANIETGVSTPSVRTAKLLGNALGFDWTKFYEDESETVK